ncbi:MAG: molybdopterin-dependent oxidoreductase [Melioribacteraceae bacterium]|nr:molybdopterin-dependent oxidoreductase [Melioribacteraceae bacterium]
MKNLDTEKHIKGKSLFIDDFPTPDGTLILDVFYSSVAHAKIVSVDYSEAEKLDGVKKIITAGDIIGENQIGGIIHDETLLAENEVTYIGEPIAIIAAKDKRTAHKAKSLINIKYEELPVITDPKEACEKGELIIPPRIFSCGDIYNTWDCCDYIFEDTVETGGQEHLYLETQGSIAIPVEGKKIKIISSTQGPTYVQKAVSKVLNIPMHFVEVDVLRLGGAFGGKEDQATAFGAMAGLAAYILQRPAKLVLNRHDDLVITGKRHPYISDYKIGLNKEGKILAYEVSYYQNSGACADLSTPILDRSLFHATNSYSIPNVKSTGYCCRTNLAPNTAFRGFGGPQAMFVIEAAIHKAAEEMGIDVEEIQKKNLVSEKDVTHYGQVLNNCNAQKCFNQTTDLYNYNQLKLDVKKFNSENDQYKKGIAIMPICFGISFTNSFLNQGSALIHIYTDGSVQISAAAVEMGQGVNQKLRLIAANVFSIPVELITVESTNTTRVANTSPTAASSGADLNGNAVFIACNNLLDRLINRAAEILNITDPKLISIKNGTVYISGEKTDLAWNGLIEQAYFNRVNLSSQALYTTPEIYFDKETNKGNPFAYHVYGTAVITSKVDCVRGIYNIESVKLVHDFGKSIDPVVDKGQTEGAVVQGLGWLTIEEIAHNVNGKLLSDTLSTYKVPDIYFAPDEIEIEFLEDSENRFGPLNSKAIGEPPFMYGIGGYFSIINAIKSFNPKLEINYSAPITPEKVLMSLYGK